MSSKDLDFRLEIRRMNFDEIEQAAKIFSSVDLNDSMSTLETYYESDPNSFTVALDKDSDKVIGSCASPLTTHQTHFLGLYVVEPRYQGLGIGVQMFQRCLNIVGERNCGLNAVPSKLKIYRERAGFELMEGRAMVIVEGHPNDLSILKGSEHLDSRYRCVRFQDLDHSEDLFRKIIEFDKTVHLDDRTKLLRSMLIRPDTITMTVIDTLDDSKPVVGYGSIHIDIINRLMLGPLYAQTDQIAETLMCELFRAKRIDCGRNQQVAYFTMDNSIGSLRMAKDVLGLKEMARCEKVYTKYIPPFNYNYLYCCHSPDFSC
ncbi:hypothetical protein SSS_05429 [Sarcoptes scabiei]|uniref:GNAT-like acetyltransferase domain containing protein n=1 Tax=Sarcoptes scabiei TaxID=52283 RepID=A0A131ZU11_SARSC|nr:hypothetical protein SSS_05429 [Sarcoptes scabiei]KPL99480.1 GNAT-like acetyltransferase domain containing protein [Sarcoptes scabiei]